MTQRSRMVLPANRLTSARAADQNAMFCESKTPFVNTAPDCNSLQ